MNIKVTYIYKLPDRIPYIVFVSIHPSISFLTAVILIINLINFISRGVDESTTIIIDFFFLVYPMKALRLDSIRNTARAFGS